MRPECPLCVRRECANCFHVDQQINRQWIALHHPGGECRRCGAARSAVTEKPVRHTNRAKHEDHVRYAEREQNPTPRIERSPIDIAEALDLLDTLDKPFFRAYTGRKMLPTDNDLDRPLYDEDTRAKNWNEGTAKLLELVAVVRRWVTENTGDGDG